MKKMIHIILGGSCRCRDMSCSSQIGLGRGYYHRTRGRKRGSERLSENPASPLLQLLKMQRIVVYLRQYPVVYDQKDFVHRVTGRYIQLSVLSRTIKFNKKHPVHDTFRGTTSSPHFHAIRTPRFSESSHNSQSLIPNPMIQLLACYCASSTLNSVVQGLVYASQAKQIWDYSRRSPSTSFEPARALLNYTRPRKRPCKS